MNIQKILFQSLNNFSENNALYIDDKYYTYSFLKQFSVKTAKSILNIENKKQSVIIMGSRSFYTYAGILGTIISGSYYTPLNETFPIERNINIIKISQAKTIVLDIEDFKNYETILDNLENYNIICLNGDINDLKKRFPKHNFDYKDNNLENIEVCDDDTIYMLFTSGSTGVPKGIKISHYNIYNYIHAFIKRNPIYSDDRFIQMNDLTFDLSVHSLFLPLLHGACLYIPNNNERINPVKFINQNNITHALMVPSSIIFMKKMRVLRKQSFCSLKYLAFGGEALPFDNAILMAKAAPNAKLENIYGPTEATVACTYFEFDKDTKELPVYSGSMPIGKAYDGMEVELYDENLNKITDDSIGQIVLSGKQLAKGYVNNEEQTKEKFVMIDNSLHYLTGDLGRRINGELVFLGRNDSQVQIKGYRVEIFEIEHAISKINGIISNAVIPTPVGAVTYENTTAFITCNTNIDLIKIKEELSKKLPNYMVPNNIIILDNMPLNSNGKIDRNQLKKILQP